MAEKIKELLLQECNIVYDTKLNVSNYNDVINVWLQYKNEKKLNIDEENSYLIKSIFDFHEKNIDHVILYYSKHMMDCLIMCKVNEKYMNIQIPTEENIIHLNRSFIAVYC